MHAAPFAQWDLYVVLSGGTFAPKPNGWTSSTLFNPGWLEVSMEHGSLFSHHTVFSFGNIATLVFSFGNVVTTVFSLRAVEV